MRSDVHSVSMGILIPAVLVLVSPSDVTAVTSEDGAAHPNSVGSVAGLQPNFRVSGHEGAIKRQ
jgi:hypothetical protein